MSDKSKDFDEWFKKYTACVRCGNDTSMRLAASNAWYIQDSRIKELEAEVYRLNAYTISGYQIVLKDFEAENAELKNQVQFHKEMHQKSIVLKEKYCEEITSLQSEKAILIEALETHDCQIGSTYFDGEDRTVSECHFCTALSKARGNK